MGHKVVKHLVVVVLILASLGASAPALGQALTSAGYDFVDAVKKSDGGKATNLLDTHPTGLINTKDNDGNTALIIALNRSDEQWTAFLLTKGADPNLAGKAGDTPMIVASRVGFETAVEWLISEGAKVDATNRMGETPLIVAVQQHQIPVVRILLSQGADPDRADHAAGYSARDYATRDPRAREIQKMIQDRKPKAAASAAN